MTEPTSSSALQAGGDETPVATTIAELMAAVGSLEATVYALVLNDGDMDPHDPALKIERDRVRKLALSLASPVAPAGVPRLTEEQITQIIEHADGSEFSDHEFARAIEAAVLSAGAPAVPLQDEQDSDSSHLAAPGSTVPTALTVGTPAAQWRVDGEPDPHGSRYDGERADLAMGDLTDDALANGVFLHGDGTHGRPRIEDVIAGKASMPIAWLTAAKDRIRCLSRKLIETESALAAIQCDGRDGVTDNAASSEAAEGTTASNESDGHGKDCA